MTLLLAIGLLSLGILGLVSHLMVRHFDSQYELPATEWCYICEREVGPTHYMIHDEMEDNWEQYW